MQTGCIETGEAYPHIEISFRLRGIEGNPFAAEVWGLIARPGGSPVRVPAFHDGGETWRVRYTPDRRGAHRVEVTLGPAGADRPAPTEDLSASTFEVTGDPLPGFVRRSLSPTQRFVLDNGRPYFPIGYNVGWGAAEQFEMHHRAMRQRGLNWSRHWMAGFAGLNLDWHADVEGAVEGRLDLAIARVWDRIVRSAETNGIRFQLVLQHHGQYSTEVNSNWGRCPWNVANGGFLATPAEFFTDARARALTRLKYRYVVARWGYSTSVMAWELFNEVQHTDAWTLQGRDAVSRWHAEMAAHIRSLDPYRHLVTTSSSDQRSVLAPSVDYYQPHAYRRDMIAAVSTFGDDLVEPDKPIFYGEVGDDRVPAHDARDGRHQRSMLWAGVMAGGAGGAQHWHWDRMETIGEDFRAVARFLKAAEVGGRSYRPARVRCASAVRGSLTIHPDGGFDAGDAFVELPTDGRPVAGPERMPAYLHGNEEKRRRGHARQLLFMVDSSEAWALTVDVETVAKAGATATIEIDGREVVAFRWGPGGEDIHPDERLSLRVPSGRHLVAVGNGGGDWFKVRSYTFSRAVPALGVVGCAAEDAACVWVYHRSGIHGPETGPVRGSVTIPGLRRGTYEIEWWHTGRGARFTQVVARTNRAGSLRFETPPVARDAAAIVRRTGR